METVKLSHKEMTKHFRNRLKKNGIKANCRMLSCCGSEIIQVFAPTFESRFSIDEIKTICHIAICNGLKFVRGLEIEPEHQALLTEKNHFEFYMI